MTKIEQSIVIEAPLKEVFSYASDWAKWEEWFEGVSNFKPTTKNTKGNGTRYKYKAKLMGFSIMLETEINDFKENKGWTGIATKGMPHKTFWNFEQIENNTKFTYGLEYKLPIPLIGSLLDSMFLKPQWHKIIGRSLLNLKKKF